MNNNKKDDFNTIFRKNHTLWNITVNENDCNNCRTHVISCLRFPISYDRQDGSGVKRAACFIGKATILLKYLSNDIKF